MEIRPFEAIGPLCFGKLRDDVHDALKAPLQRFRKFENTPEIDVSNDLGLHLYYDGRECLEFVEAFDPAIVSFRGITFLGRDIQKVVEDMKACGFDVTVSDDSGVTFGEAGIAVFAPSGIVEGVAAFRKGYYDKVVSSPTT